MRIFLGTFVIVIGSIVMIHAIDSVDKMQDSKMQRFCEQIPSGVSYDEICAKYKYSK